MPGGVSVTGRIVGWELLLRFHRFSSDLAPGAFSKPLRLLGVVDPCHTSGSNIVLGDYNSWLDILYV